MKKWRNKILSAVLVLSLLLTSSSFAFAADGDSSGSTTQEVKITRDEIAELVPSSQQSNDKDVGGNIWCAFDGKNNSGEIWHTSYSSGNSTDSDAATGKIKSVKIELKEPQWISKIIYYPRTSQSNGIFNGCNMYINDDGSNNWNNKVGTATNWENNSNPKTLTLTDSVYTKYILLEATGAYGDNNGAHASALEFEIYKDMSKYPTITEQPKSIISSEAQVTLTVNAVASDGISNLTYQWYSYTDDISNATEVQNGTSNAITVIPTETMTYYYVKVTQNIDGNDISINSEPVYVKSPDDAGTLTQINIDNGLSIVDYSSVGGGSAIEKAIDKEKNYTGYNFWETMWDGSDTELYMTFDLGKTYSLAEVNYYYGRTEGTGNGVPKYLEIWTSVDNIDWTLSKVAEITETLKPGTSNKYYYDVRIKLDSVVNARYVKFHPQNNEVYEGTSFAIGEAEFFVDLSSETLITEQPIINDNGYITIGTAIDSTIEWYKNTSNTTVNAEQIDGESGNILTPSKIESAYYFAKVTKNDKSEYSSIVYVQSEEAMIDRGNDDVIIGTFSEVINQAISGDTINVLRDIYLTAYSTINLNKSITITSFGDSSFKIQRTSDTKSSVLFTIADGGELTLDNIIIDGGALWDGSDDVLLRGTTNNGVSGSEKFFDVSNGGELNIINGTIIQNNSAGNINGSIIAVYGKNTKIQISDSVIRNNSTSGFATVLYARTNDSSATEEEISTISINNSDIYGNSTSSETGGTILLEQRANLNISGGSISNNNGGSNGGAIYMFGDSNVTIENGTIFNNNKAGCGGAIYINTNGVLNLGESTFIDNSSNDTSDYEKTVGNAIMYFNGTMNIIGQPNFDINNDKKQDIYISKGDKAINIQVPSLNEGSIVLAPQGPNTISNFNIGDFRVLAKIDPTVENPDLNSLAKIFTIIDHPDQIIAGRAMYVNNENGTRYIGYGAANTNAVISGTSPITISVIKNSFVEAACAVTATGTDITYKWYKCSEDGTIEGEVIGTEATLSIEGIDGYYICEVINGEASTLEPVKSAVVTVTACNPCSKAIDKFKNL